MASTILATFDRTEDAHAAINELQDAGFKRGDIGLALNDASKTYTAYLEDEEPVEGAGFGAGAGAVVGALTGLVAITVPGIGPIIAAGPLSAVFGALAGAGVGAVSGAVTGGVVSSLMDLGVSEEDAHYYAEGLRRGSALVAVSVTEHDADRAMYLLRKHNPVDIDRRVSQWRAGDWKRFDPNMEPYTPEKLDAERAAYRGYEDDTEDYDDQDDPMRFVRHYPIHY